MRIGLNRALKTGSLVALALCGCATAKEETVTVFEGSSPGTYWEFVGWDSRETTGSWKPWTEPEYEARERSVGYVNEFTRRGWGTVAPWCWLSNGRCFLYQVMAWQEVQPADDSHTTPVQDPGNRFEAAYYREGFIPRFLEEPRVPGGHG